MSVEFKNVRPGWVEVSAVQKPDTDGYDTHCPTCDAPEPWHTATCAVVHVKVGEPSDAQVQALKVLEEAEPLAEVFGNSTAFGRAVIALRRLVDERATEEMQ